MPAIARKFHGVPGILAVLAAVFAAFARQTIARWMSALTVFLHDEIMGSLWANLRKLSSRQSVRAVTRWRLPDLRGQILQINRRVGLLLRFKPRADRDSFPVVFEPREKLCLLRPGQPLLVEPGVIGAHIGIHQ